MTELYAGDISPLEAWEKLKDDPDSVLVDVRTEAEWAWVGQVDLSELGKKHLYVEWNQFPSGQPNPDFLEQVTGVLAQKDHTILFLCRSGVRSKHAAIALSGLGYQKCFNIAYGFEGDKDTNQHRGSINGWKVAGLPWKQG